MQAGEVQVALTINTVLNVAAATAVVLKVKGPNDDDTRDLTTVIATTSVTRTTTATDFPIGGDYQIQLEATFPGGKILLSDVFPLRIGDAL